MQTSASIDFNIQVSASITGDAPTKGGRISFPASRSGSLPCADGLVSMRIGFDDLNLAGGSYSFRLYFGAEYLKTLTYSPVLSNSGDPVPNISGGNFFYLSSNRTIQTITALFSVPGYLAADDFVIHKGGFGISGSEDDEVLALLWDQAEIDANTSGFYCDLILGAALI